jgi:CubicO group peptidase (beta-lactamase class C family)
MIVLGEVAARIGGAPLEDLASEAWERCSMFSTRFNPPPVAQSCAVSTEWDASSGRYLRGTVHDENARLLGGVAGHAGAFSSARDLMIFASLVLGGGRTPDGEQMLSSDYIEQSLRDATPGLGVSRGLVWDLASFGSRNERVAVHHGFTGTSLLVSQGHQLAVVLLTNAVQNSRDKARLEVFRHSLFDGLLDAF